jgi:hypothetical protein
VPGVIAAPASRATWEEVFEELSQRVLSTDQALAAVGEIQSLLRGRVREDLERLKQHGQLLCEEAVWDGPEAVRFRTEVWPRMSAAVDQALRRLTDLDDHARKINQDIMSAGGGGGTGSPAATAGVPDARVRSALDYFHHHLHGGNFLTGDQGDLEGIDRQLQGLSPEELDQFIDSLSPQDLQEWNKRISDSGGFLFHQDGLNNDDRIALGNTLLASAGPEELARLRQYMPWLEPGSSVDKVKISGWESGGSLPLFDPGTGRPEPETDINQGQDGDCWFMSGLGAVAERNPDLIAQHIQANPNGTYTVTFYRDGRPTQVTVTDDYPSGPNGWDGYAYSHTSTDGAKWVMIYEKAYAEFKGGYGSINGGYGSTALSDLTGADATRDGTGDHTLADINAKIQQGYAITSGSQQKWPWDGEMENSPGGNVVREHEYYVQGVDTNAHPPTITLVNPWGSGGDAGNPAAPQYVTLTQDQWHQYFDSVSYARVGG